MASRTRPRQSSVTVEVTACAVPIGARRGAWCQRMGGHTPGGGDARAGRAGTARRATGALDWVRGRVDCADALASTVHARAARSQRLLYTHPTRSLPAAPVVASPRVHSTTFYIYYSLSTILTGIKKTKGERGTTRMGKTKSREILPRIETNHRRRRDDHSRHPSRLHTCPTPYGTAPRWRSAHSADRSTDAGSRMCVTVENPQKFRIESWDKT